MPHKVKNKFSTVLLVVRLMDLKSLSGGVLVVKTSINITAYF